MEKGESNTRKIIYVIVIALVWILVIIEIARSFSELYIPTSLDDVKKLSQILLEYKKTEQFKLLILYCLTYLLNQTVGLPSEALFNIIGGILYGYAAVPLLCFLVALGSAFTFLLSKHLLGQLIFNYCIPKSTLLTMKSAVDENRGHLLYYLIAVRAFPFTPAFLTNLAYPLIGVDILTFSIASFIGIAPFSFICVDAAKTIANLESMSDIFSFGVMLKLVLISAAFIVPLIFKKRIIAYFNKSEEEIPLGEYLE
ncbi:Transmembrane protein 41A [Terramyces sp. JEL0728]|nr:Transmembrane protein 41A [Terramyces sp. JEL0728]